MGSKKNRKQTRPAPVVKAPSKGTQLLWPGIAVAVLALAGAYMVSVSSDPVPSTLTTDAMTQTATTAQAETAGSTTSAVSGTPFVPEGPNDLPMPPLPYVSQMTGSPELVKQAYVFAAQNPGVLEHVPCYCGCENDGHRSNVDCFVGSRAANGAVETWDTHGMT
jgi:hypothetical protein